MKSASSFFSILPLRSSIAGVVLAYLLCYSLSASAQTQPYKRAVGLKLSYYGIATFKTFLGSTSHAVELGVGTRGYAALGNRWTTITAAYLVHKDIDSFLASLGIEDQNITAYFGAGASAYLWSYRSLVDRDRYGSRSLGLQVYGGAEYRFEELPLVVGLEYSPSFFFGRAYFNGLGLGYGTVTIKYILSDGN